jgi:hypothetical protein
MSDERATREKNVNSLLQLLFENACSYRDSKDRNRERVPGTCEWFTKHSLFKQWNSSGQGQGPGLLFVTADPGCGKSVLSRYLIDEVLPDDRNRTICYFFFKDDFEAQKSSTRAICTLLHQIFVSDRQLVTDAILEKYKAYGTGFVQSFSEMWNAFLITTSHRETVCVFDALDECQSKDRKQLIAAATKTYKNGVGQVPLKILLTSRPYHHVRGEIFQELGPLLASIHMEGDSGPLSNEIAEEIKLVVNSRVDQCRLQRQVVRSNAAFAGR